MHRHDLTNEQWEQLMVLLPPEKPHTGRPNKDLRRVVNAIVWILATGAPWRDLPERFGPWQTVYDHFAQWRRSGVFARIIDKLQVRLDEHGLIDWELWCVDGANVRAARAAAGADKKASPATP